MTRAKFNIKKFDETSDFVLWRIKMCALLIQHGYEAALEVLLADMKAQTKAGLNKKAHSIVILCLGNKILREVTGETTASRVWSKLETLYMKRSLANKLYLKKKLYTFYMSTGRNIFEHIDEFNKIVLDLANIEEIKERSKAKEDDGEGLYVRGRTDLRASCQSRGKSRSKSRGERLKCYIFQSEDHLKRNCPKNNHKKSTGYVKKDEQPSSSGSTYDDSEVMSVHAQALLDWIMDSGCSYHMTPRYIPELKRYLISLGTLEKEGYIVKLQSGKVKVSLMLVLKKKTVLRRFGTKDYDISVRLDNRKAHYSGSDRLCLFKLMGSISGGIVRRFKHEAFGNFKEWKQLLCIESGIARHLTVSEMPQQNGVAERMNKTFIDKVRI
nr:retrovirus-related Pol polyprotein from transposon TNT 1-94 [Tanacetum cinerariifolium]